MVVTRRQRALSGTRPTAAQPDIGMRRRRWRKMYRPTDPHKRHRIRDSQPKTQRVVSYSRRT